MHFLLIAGTVFAQAPAKLPVHGWLTATGNTVLDGSELQLGVAIPFTRVTALALEGQATGLDAGFGLGPTFEFGSLYLAPMAVVEGRFAGGMGVGGQLLLAWEAPPLPLYLEARVRAESDLGSGLSVADRSLLLITLPWFAVGAEHDALFPMDASTGYNRLGGRLNVAMGKSATVGIFAGAELDEQAKKAANSGFDGQLTLTFRF